MPDTQPKRERLPACDRGTSAAVTLKIMVSPVQFRVPPPKKSLLDATLYTRPALVGTLPANIQPTRGVFLSLTSQREAELDIAANRYRDYHVLPRPAPLAELVEHRTFNPMVDGSSPSRLI